MRAYRILFGTLLIAASFAAHADLKVVVGPTPIPRGNATSSRDITVSNEFFAVAFAVETAPPWGVARGGIVDIAIVRDGEIGFDFASLADFMPNRWSSWPTSYQRVTITKQTAADVVINTVRDWGAVELETTFAFQDGSHMIHIVTRMTNQGDEAIEDIYSGYVVWPEGGSLFGVPGLHGVEYSLETDAFADWSASYDEHWTLGLHAPFAELVAYNGRDRYLPHDLQAKESREFEAWLQIEDDGSLAPLVQAEINFSNKPFGRVTGRVKSSDGQPIERPAVVAIKDGSPYAWAIGRDGAYAFDLPVGDYAIYATARGFAPGATRELAVTGGSETQLDFADVEPPGSVHFRVLDKDTGQALDARIDIQSGPRSLTGFFGRNTLFTELNPVGETVAVVPPGAYSFLVSAAGGFTSIPQVIENSVKSGKTTELRAEIAV
jgi:hypothetical protein